MPFMSLGMSSWPLRVVWLIIAVWLSAVSPVVGQVTGVMTTVNNTNSSSWLTTTQVPPTCPPDYTDCRCVFLREPAKYYYDTGFLPHQISVWRDLVCAVYGFPFGLGRVSPFYSLDAKLKSK